MEELVLLLVGPIGMNGVLTALLCRSASAEAPLLDRSDDAEEEDDSAGEGSVVSSSTDTERGLFFFVKEDLLLELWYGRGLCEKAGGSAKSLRRGDAWSVSFDFVIVKGMLCRCTIGGLPPMMSPYSSPRALPLKLEARDDAAVLFAREFCRDDSQE